MSTQTAATPVSIDPPKRRLPTTWVELNRSTKLEGKVGYYDGRLIKTRYIRLPAVVR